MKLKIIPSNKIPNTQPNPSFGLPVNLMGISIGVVVEYSDDIKKAIDDGYELRLELVPVEETKQ